MRKLRTKEVTKHAQCDRDSKQTSGPGVSIMFSVSYKVGGFIFYAKNNKNMWMRQ